MDTTDPKITFNEEGVCDHCQTFNVANKRRWGEIISGARALELDQLVERIKIEGRNQKYDSIIGLSGGSDSSYMLHLAVHELGLRPLVFHVDAGWNSKQAVENIRALVEKLGLDLQVTVIDWETMRKLQIAYFRAGVPDLDTPQDHAFFSAMYQYAKSSGVKTILNGGNLSTESVCVPLDWMYYASDVRQLKAIYENSFSDTLDLLPMSSALYHKIYLRFVRGIKIVKLLDYIPYLKTTAEKVLMETYGWQPFEEKHFESTFTRFNEGYWLPTRFGFDPRKTTYSSCILTGQITRAEALERLTRPSLNADRVKIETRYISNKLRLSHDELEHYLRMPKAHFTDYPNLNGVYKLGSAVLRKLGIEKSVKR